MSKRKEFGLWTKDYQKALVSGYVPVEGIDRFEVADYIHHFLVASYETGSNPVPHLRKIFPDLEWRYKYLSENGTEESDERELYKIVIDSDFIWHAFDTRGACRDFIVARRRKIIKESPWKFYYPDTFDELPVNPIGRIRILQFQAFGAQQIPITL